MKTFKTNNMKNKSTNIISKTILSLGLIMTLFIACEKDFLEKTDPGTGSVDGFYTSAAEFALGVNGIYGSMYDSHYTSGKFWGGNYFHMVMDFDVVSDNGVGQGAAWKGYSQLASGLVTPNTGEILHWKWNYGFSAISKINAMLAIMDDVTFEGNEAQKWEGELRFLRGYIYSELATLYGGVPIITSPISGEEADALTRASQAATFAQAVTDLEYAAANLGLDPNNGDFGRPTSMTANTTLGHTHLRTGNWAAAQSAFAKVVAQEGSKTSLAPMDKWEGLHDGSEEYHPEILWSMQNDFGFESTGDYVSYGMLTSDGFNGWTGIKFTQDLLDSFQMTDGQSIASSSLYDAANPYDNRDPRLRATFYLAGDVSYDGTIVGDAQFSGACCNGDLRGLAEYGIAPAMARKYTQKTDWNVDFGGSWVNLNVYRYADVLLMHAEALNEGGNPTAAAGFVNKVRNRANMPDVAAGLSQSQMRDAILHERRVEFALEGKRFFDLKRQGMLVETVNGNRGWDLHGGANFKPHYVLWPIPGPTVANSPNIEQNPGY